METHIVQVESPLLGLHIRHAQREDLPSLEWDGEFTHFRRLYAEAFRRSQLGEAVLWVAEIPQNNIIGQLFVHMRSERKDLADGKTRAYIYGFRIRPAYRNQGVGNKMMDVAEQDLFQRGYQYAVLNVGRDNPDARRLYERRGYRVVGGDPGRWSYLDDQGVRQNVVEPAWRMLKELNHNSQR